MIYLLFYIFLALLTVTIMLTLRDAILKNGLSNSTFTLLTIAGAILAPILWVMIIIYVVCEMFNHVWKNRNTKIEQK